MVATERAVTHLWFIWPCDPFMIYSRHVEGTWNECDWRSSVIKSTDILVSYQLNPHSQTVINLMHESTPFVSVQLSNKWMNTCLKLNNCYLDPDMDSFDRINDPDVLSIIIHNGECSHKYKYYTYTGTNSWRLRSTYRIVSVHSDNAAVYLSAPIIAIIENTWFSLFNHNIPPWINFTFCSSYFLSKKFWNCVRIICAVSSLHCMVAAAVIELGEGIRHMNGEM